MKPLVLALLLFACRKPTCEELKATFMKWSDEHDEQLLYNPNPHADMSYAQARYERERAQADKNFIGACHEMKIDPTCFENSEDYGTDKCRTMRYELFNKLYR